MGTVYRYGDSVDDTAEKNFSVFSLTRMRSGKYMRVVKLCTNKLDVATVAGTNIIRLDCRSSCDHARAQTIAAVVAL